MSGRIKKSVRNSAMALVGQILNVILNFIVRTVFIKALGNSYLGINGLFSNILSLLSFAELGFGTAIVYALYKPLADNDEHRISALMNFYAKVYRIVGLFILLAGMGLLPFLEKIIGDPSQLPVGLPPIQYIYIMYLLNTASSYFFIYKRSLIIASQNGYLDSLNQLEFTVFRNIIQIAVLVFTKSFVAYLFIQIVFTLAENVAISRRANKLFPYLEKYREEKLGLCSIKSIFKNVLAMACHKMGSVIVSGTDNILITQYVGLVATGIYSNYVLLTSTVRVVYLQIMSPITASLGNLVATDTIDKSYAFFKRILFLNGYISVFCTVCLASLSNSFIEIFWGKESAFSTGLVLMIMTNFYINCMRKTSEMYIDTIGLFWQVRWKSIVEALINLITSVVFASALNMGIAGIVLGTITSNVLTNLWWEPYTVYHFYFQKPLLYYFIEYSKYFAVLAVSIACVLIIENRIADNVGGIIAKCIISMIIPNLLFYVVFRKTKEYGYFIQIIKQFTLRKITNEGKK